jgi:hypothetical protein
VLLLVFLVAGCGPVRIKARGRVVKKGEPFVPSEQEVMHIAFFPASDESNDAGRSYVVKFNRTDGTFQVVGADGKGCPPGKYRVALRLIKDRKDQLKGAFDVDSSPFVFDVSSVADDITLDLATPSKPSSAKKANNPAQPVQPVRKSRS